MVNGCAALVHVSVSPNVIVHGPWPEDSVDRLVKMVRNSLNYISVQIFFLNVVGYIGGKKSY